MRFYTIEAEDIEELKKKYKESVNQNIYVNNSNKYSLDRQKDEENSSNNNIDNNNNLNYQNEYQGYDKINDYSEDELNENDDNINQEDILKESSTEDEKNLELLCLYLKQSIALMTNNKHIRNINIFYRSKNPIQTFSGNAIYDLDIKELVDDITSENDIKSNEDQSSRSNSLKEFIIQNIKGDFTLKIMIASNSDYIRNLFVNKFLNLDNSNDIEESDFEIRRQQIRLFNKNISLQIFDTSNRFHKHKFSKLYYQFSNGFFIFIEATNHNVKEYLEYFFRLSEEYCKEKAIVIFGVNMLFENNCTIDGLNLKEFSLRKNCIFIPIRIENFSTRNSIIMNILNLILIKKIDNNKTPMNENKKLCEMEDNITHKIKSLSSKKVVNIYDITKMNIPDSFGYKQKYRMNHLNAFDTEKNNMFMKRNHRKYSDI